MIGSGMLSFLLFAGALHVDLNELLKRKWAILSTATVGVVLSTFLIGAAMWVAFDRIWTDAEANIETQVGTIGG